MKDELQALITALEVAAPDNALASDLLDRAHRLDRLDEEQLSRAVEMVHETFEKTERMFPLGEDGQLASTVLALINGDQEDEVDEDEEEGL